MQFGNQFLQFGPIGSGEMIFLILLAVVLLFGAKKIPEIAKAFGRAKGEFERGKQEIDKEIREAEKEVKEGSSSKKEESEREKLIKAANALGISTYGKTDEQLREEIQVALKK
ncbi:MAG: twin-arginine translocase TatA/TatE family subunit [archaeon]|nr:twin-arginine translocase TatA/TatE family subunit [archaeon]MCP8306433.1 twin-arginine translocase TatA/TatE family subunit [archaeon]